MTIRRNEAGDVEVKVNVFRNGTKLQSSDGADDIYDFITGIEIYESITSSTIEVKLLFNHGSGFIGDMTGSEMFRIIISGTIMEISGNQSEGETSLDVILSTEDH